MSNTLQYEAMVSYFNSLLSESDEDDNLNNSSSAPLLPKDKNEAVSNFQEETVKPLLQAQVEDQVVTRPYAEVSPQKASLQDLLANVPQTDEVVAVETQVETVSEPVVQVEVQTTEVIVEPVVQTVVAEPITKEETYTVTSVQTVEVQATQVEEQVQLEPEVAPAPVWKNIEVGEEFNALFFKVAGVTLAVPLVSLGGIFEPTDITSLFGKPAWFTGITNIQGRKTAVVDTAKWMLPNTEIIEHEYRYVIKLDTSLWCIQCDELLGTENISKSSVKWRETSGARPWLAGIVKHKMCALLHVEELIKMLENGVDVATLIAETK